MTQFNDLCHQQVQLYITAPYPCSYLPKKLATSQVATPSHAIDTKVYSELVRQGFRRSGMFTYRPHCSACSECQSLRVLALEFEPDRSQRRAWLRHSNLQTNVVDLSFEKEHYDLFLRYQHARHADEGKDKNTVDQYTQFMLQSRVKTFLVEFRSKTVDSRPGELKMVSIIDELDDGVSAVYTFYEPQTKSSYGTYNILWQIQFAKSQKLKHVYLGYWISECQKMNYKSSFLPQEKLDKGRWLRS